MKVYSKKLEKQQLLKKNKKYYFCRGNTPKVFSQDKKIIEAKTTFFICKPDKIGVKSLRLPSDVDDVYDVSFVNDLFFNYSFDKNRLKAFILWFYKKNGGKKVIDVIEKLKNIGFEYATKAGISLGIDDLKIPPKKKIIISEADDSIFSTLVKSQTKLVTDTERFQQTIELWNRTSENLKQSVIEYFRSTDPLNPVFMMAFSGARGNISQVRQLVGMRGLMSDPEGNVIDYPIRSNFREGLTLTEYLISCYGARKGVVDTALKTANAGYLTRRLVDVSQHVFVDLIDCNTSFGIAVEDNKQGISRKVSLKDRLVGRVLAEDIKPIAFRNQQIGKDLASQIVSVRSKVLIRSPLTCQAKKTPFGVRPEADMMDLMEKGFDRKSICQLCYGWSFYQPNLVDLGEAVGIIAGQSIGEPGTQLTMRTFHTGGVFSGEIVNELRAPRKGVIDFSEPLQGKLVRTSYGKIGFLTKVDGEILFAPPKKDGFDEQRFTKNYHEVLEGSPNDSMLIPASTILFVRQGERVFENQLIAENFLTSNRDDEEERVQAEYQVYPPFEGEISFQKSELFLRKKEIRKNASRFGFFWILAGKVYKKDYNFDKKDENPFYSNPYIKDKKNPSVLKKRHLDAFFFKENYIVKKKKETSFFLNGFYPKVGDLIDKTSLLKLSKKDIFGLTGFVCNWDQSVESDKTVSNGKKYIKTFIAKQKGLPIPSNETIKFEIASDEKKSNQKFDQFSLLKKSQFTDFFLKPFSFRQRIPSNSFFFDERLSLKKNPSAKIIESLLRKKKSNNSDQKKGLHQVVTSYEGDLLGTGSVFNEANKLVVNRPMLIKSFKNIQFSNIGYFFSFTNLPTKKRQEKFSMKASLFLKKRLLKETSFFLTGVSFLKKETFPNDQFFVSNPFSSKNTFRSSSFSCESLDFKWFPEKYKTNIGGFISFDKNLSFPLNDQTTQPLIKWVPESCYQLGVLTSLKPLTAKDFAFFSCKKPSAKKAADSPRRKNKEKIIKNLAIKNRNNKGTSLSLALKNKQNINNQKVFLNLITLSEIDNKYPLFYRVNSQGKISGEFPKTSGYSLVFEKPTTKNPNRLLPSSYELSFKKNKQAYFFNTKDPFVPEKTIRKDFIYPFSAFSSYRNQINGTGTRFMCFPLPYYKEKKERPETSKDFCKKRRTPLGDLCDIISPKDLPTFNKNQPNLYKSKERIDRTGDFYTHIKRNNFRFNGKDCYTYQTISSKYLLPHNLFNLKKNKVPYFFNTKDSFFSKKKTFTFLTGDKKLLVSLKDPSAKTIYKKNNVEDFFLTTKNQKTANSSAYTTKISPVKKKYLEKNSTKKIPRNFFFFKECEMSSYSSFYKETSGSAIIQTDCQILCKSGWLYYPKSKFLEDHQSFLPAAGRNRSLGNHICFDQVPVFLEYILNKKKDLKRTATIFKTLLLLFFNSLKKSKKIKLGESFYKNQKNVKSIPSLFSFKNQNKTSLKQYLQVKLGFCSAEQYNVPTSSSLIYYTNQINKRLVFSCQPFERENREKPFGRKNELDFFSNFNQKDFLFLLGAIYSNPSAKKSFGEKAEGFIKEKKERFTFNKKNNKKRKRRIFKEKYTNFNWHKDCLLDGFQSIFVFVNNKNFYHKSFGFLKNGISTEKKETKNIRRINNNFCILIGKVNQYSLLPVKEYKKTLLLSFLSKDKNLIKKNIVDYVFFNRRVVETKQNKNNNCDDHFSLKKKLLKAINAKKVLGFVKSDIDNTSQRFNKQFSTKKGFSFDKYHSKTGKVITPKDRIENLINGHRLGIIKEKEKKEDLLRLLRLITDWLILEIGLIIDLEINTLLSLPTNRKKARKIFYFTQNQFGQLRVSFQLLERRITDEQLLSLLKKNSKKRIFLERLFLFESLEKTVCEQVFEYLFKTFFDLKTRSNFQLDDPVTFFEKNQESFKKSIKKLIVTNLLESILLYPYFQLRVYFLFFETLIFSLYYQKLLFIKEKRLIFTNLLKPILLGPLVDSQFLVKKNTQLSFVSLQNPAKIFKTLPPNKLLGDTLPKDLQSIFVSRTNPILSFSFVRQIDFAQNCSNPNLNKNFLHFFKDKNPVAFERKTSFSSNFFKETGFVEEWQNTEFAFLRRGRQITKKPLDLSLKPRFPSILTTKITKIITDKQFWYSYSPENPLTLTLFFSPYKAEVVENPRPFSFQGKETESSPFSSTFSLSDRYCLLLTETDQISYLSEQPKPRVAVGQLINYGDNLSENVGFPFSGQIIEIEKNQVKLRRAQPVSNLSSGSVHVKDGDFIKKNQPLITTFYQKLTNEDIVQGIPKIEQLFEARRTKQGLPLPGNLPDKLEDLFSIEMKKPKNNRKKAAQISFAKIQRILIDKIQNVYISQGVTIADKHLEIVVRQMTSKVVILEDHFYDGIFPLSRPWFLPGEFVDLDDAESANAVLYPRQTQLVEPINQQQDFSKPFIYKPILLGVTTASLESESFISAASFQETTRILSRAATKGRKDFLHGLKERVILGDLINVGTGSVKIFPFFEKTFFSREFRKNQIREVREQIVAQMDTLFAQREIIVDQISKILAPISYLEETLKQPLQEVEEILFTDWYKEEYDKYRIRHNLFDSKKTKNLRYINSLSLSLSLSLSPKESESESFIYKNQIRDFPETIGKQCGVMPYLKEKLKEDKSYLLPPYYGVDPITGNFYFKYTPFFLNSFTDRFAQTTAYIYTQLALIPYLEEKLKEDKSYFLPAHYGVDSITNKVYLKKNDSYLRYLIDHFSQTKTSIVQFFIFLIHTNNKLLKKKE